MHRENRKSTRKEMTQMLSWKIPTIVGKNHDSPQAAEYTMGKEYNNGDTQRQLPLAPVPRHTAVTMEATTSFSLSLSLSLSITIHSYTHAVQLTIMFHTLSKVSCVCPKSYLYTYDFRVEYQCIMVVFNTILFECPSSGHLCKYDKGQLP